ncbi:MAG: SPOR domain-containing protein [Gammaproteobacteria bacterium]|jgi:TPR repeat protein
MNTDLGQVPKIIVQGRIIGINMGMNNMFRILFSLLLLFSTSAYAGTYEEGKQAYLSQDYQRALEILKPLAENGNSQAQITLGLMYDYGQGVDKDPTESINWYRMAAEQGVPLVQHDIGVKYFQGQSVEQNYDEAAKWWEMSASAGIADSQFNLGLMYYRGIGIPKDYIKAGKLFDAAAAQGHGNAQYSLAVMYAFGQSKKKDYDTALKWFNKAAAQDVAQAQFNLGVFHENGYGVTKNIAKAREWYQLAADQGLQEAVEKLKTLPAQNNNLVTKSKPTTATPSISENITPEAVAHNELDLSDWLQQQAADNYTIQLVSVVNENDIINYIKTSGFDSKAGYVKVIVNGTTRYTAIYGLYDTYQNAKFGVNELPSAVQRAKPWVRNTGILQGLLP